MENNTEKGLLLPPYKGESYYYAGIDPYKKELKWYQKILQFLKIKNYDISRGEVYIFKKL